jgi:hypothetical protein
MPQNKHGTSQTIGVKVEIEYLRRVLDALSKCLSVPGVRLPLTSRSPSYQFDRMRWEP